MACPEYEQWILESVEGSLPSEEQRRLEEHLERCGDCRTFDEFQRALDQALAAHIPAPSLPADFRPRLMRRLSAAAREKPPSVLPELLDFIGIAAAVVAGGFLLHSLLGLPAARRLSDGGHVLSFWAPPAACIAVCAWFALGPGSAGWRQRKNWPM